MFASPANGLPRTERLACYDYQSIMYLASRSEVFRSSKLWNSGTWKRRTLERTLGFIRAIRGFAVRRYSSRRNSDHTRPASPPAQAVGNEVRSHQARWGPGGSEFGCVHLKSHCRCHHHHYQEHYQIASSASSSRSRSRSRSRPGSNHNPRFGKKSTELVLPH